MKLFTCGETVYLGEWRKFSHAKNEEEAQRILKEFREKHNVK